MRKIAISGHTHGNKTPMILGFPGLITGLCRQVGVDIPKVATKRISSVVHEDYVVRYYLLKLTGEAAPQPHAHAPPGNSIRTYLLSLKQLSTEGGCLKSSSA
ncbi:hypothetical protein RYX36_021024 [Vicia faba]